MPIAKGQLQNKEAFLQIGCLDEWHQLSVQLLTHQQSVSIYFDHKFSKAHPNPDGKLSGSGGFVHGSALGKNALSRRLNLHF